MKISRALLLVVFFLAFLQVQCLLVPDDTEKGTRVANQRPSVRITAGASTPDTTGIDYKVLFRWNGVDVDGVVSLFQYAIDDTVSEDAWRDTTEFSARILFSAETGDPDPDDETRFTDWHTFYVRAVDNENATSEPDHRFFNAVTIAPETTIKFPANLAPIANLQQTLVIRWDGEDLDSSNPERKPVAWEYKLAPVRNLVTDSNEEIEGAIRDSLNFLLDTLRVGDRTGWIRVPFEESTIRLANLAPTSQLAFAVRAVDEAGAIEPSLERNRNYIAFIVTGEIGRPFVRVTEPSAGTSLFGVDQEPWEISVPSGRELRFTWEGNSDHYGSEPGNSNYGLDIPDPEDESLRDPNGIGGWIGWGRWEGTTRPIVFTDAEAGQTHRFWVKMRDISDSKESERLCEVAIFVVPFTFEKLVLVLDDSKLSPDEEHDAFVYNTLVRRFADFGEIEEYPLWSLPGQPEGFTPIGAERLELARLAQYQYLVWHSHLGLGGGPTLPLATVEGDGDRNGRGLLRSYMSAGGRLLLLGDRLSSHFTAGVFRYPKEAPQPDDLDGTSGDFSNRGFIWDFMRVRNYIVSERTGAQPAELEASGLVGALSVHPAYPDIQIDAAKWNPWDVVEGRFRGGVRNWEAVQGERRPIERLAGLDTLYTPVTFDTTYALGPREAHYEDAVLAWRYESTRADTVANTVQGRIVVWDFQPYYFDAATVQDAATASINWLMTGRDH